MLLIERIHPLIFFISFCIGLFFVYIFSPEPDIIFKYPTPENAHKLVFTDDADNCYKYVSNEVQCTDDAKDIPIQKKNSILNL
jgi:hypothetical protein